MTELKCLSTTQEPGRRRNPSQGRPCSDAIILTGLASKQTGTLNRTPAAIGSKVKSRILDPDQ